jgi:type II secretory pathway component PulM
MSRPSQTPAETLDALHQQLARVLADYLDRTPAPSAAMLNCIRQFLRNNGIEVSRVRMRAALKQVQVDNLPFTN